MTLSGPMLGVWYVAGGVWALFWPAGLVFVGSWVYFGVSALPARGDELERAERRRADKTAAAVCGLAVFELTGLLRYVPVDELSIGVSALLWLLTALPILGVVWVRGRPKTVPTGGASDA